MVDMEKYFIDIDRQFTVTGLASHIDLDIFANGMLLSKNQVWRSSWSQVPHLGGVSSRGGDELRGQHRRQELVRDRRLRHQGETQQTASSLQWRHGPGYCQGG